MCDRESEILSGGVAEVSSHGIVESVRSQSPLVVVYGYNVYTLPWRKVDVPIVAWYACDNVVISEGPTFAYVRVFYPGVFVCRLKGYLIEAVLGKDAGMCLDSEVHDGSLVKD